MTSFKRVAISVALLLLFCQWSSASASTDIIERLFDGHKIINVVDDFLVFWEQAKDKPLAHQRMLWLRLVENKHRDYFDRAVYRSTNQKTRRAMLDEFLVRVPERVDAIREFNKSILDIRTSPLVLTFIDFKTRFREYQQQRSIFIGLSLFRFDGAVRPVENDAGIPDTLCLGAEVLCRYTPEQFRIALAHEFFHLYHFGFLFEQPVMAEFRTPHIPLMIEGMAVAATEAIYPNQPRSYYLHFSDEELRAQQRDLAPSAARYLELIDSSAPPEQYELWFTNTQSDLALPRGGYLLGYEVTNRVLATFTLEQMVRMTPADLREHTEEQLAAMAGNRVLVLAPSY